MTNFGPSPVEASKPPHEPAFNVPGVVLVLGALIIAIHAIVQYLPRETYYLILALFAFIPETWSVSAAELQLPVSPYWNIVTYFFLHGDWVHVLANMTWFAAFGSAVARRLGVTRFLTFLILATIASALAHWVVNVGSAGPVIGASGAISACMGAAVRFAFVPNAGADAIHRPALSLVQSFQNRGVFIFVAVWFIFNWLFGAGVVPIPGVEGQIAWEAHMGGFVFGLLAFRLFDPVR